jgi:hypothetical protein
MEWHALSTIEEEKNVFHRLGSALRSDAFFTGGPLISKTMIEKAA